MKTWFWTPLIVAVAVAGTASRAHAQSAHPRFEAGAHFATANSSQFDVTDIGAGGRFAWRPTAMLGVEAEVNLFPREFPRDNGFSSGRVEALFGATAGPQLGRVRPFGKVRPGLLQFSAPSQPVACILIFPPPLSCTLAAGRTLFALDLGGGFEVSAGDSAFARIDLGDRLVRYPGTVVDANFVARDSAFFSHDFRFTVGGGIRF